MKKAMEMDIKSNSLLVLDGALLTKTGERVRARSVLKEAGENEGFKFLVLYELGNLELSGGNKNDAYAMFLDSHREQPDFCSAILKWHIWRRLNENFDYRALKELCKSRILQV